MAHFAEIDSNNIVIEVKRLVILIFKIMVENNLNKLQHILKVCVHYQKMELNMFKLLIIIILEKNMLVLVIFMILQKINF